MARTELVPKEAVRDAAERIALSQGPAAVTMRRVAEACGVAVGTLYRHYPSKDELLADVIGGFWYEAFHGGIDAVRNASSFEEAFRSFFLCASQAFRRFERVFLYRTDPLEKQARLTGKRREEQAFRHVGEGLTAALRRDPRIDARCWTDAFGPERFVALLLEETVRQLRRGDESPDFLLALVERTIYEKGDFYAGDHGNGV